MQEDASPGLRIMYRNDAMIAHEVERNVGQGDSDAKKPNGS